MSGASQTGGAVNQYRVGTADPVLVLELSITSWCNYSCAYCCTTVHRKRPDAIHAFDRHPVAAWAGAFDDVPNDYAVLVRGGEPFLDHANFGRLLAHWGMSPRCKYVRVDTNGSWSPDNYSHVPVDTRGRTQLNVSYHPTQIPFDRFCTRIERILDAGWSVGMINFVMEAAQRNQFEATRAYFDETHGVHVNPNPDMFDATWAGPESRPRAQALSVLGAYLPPLDVQRKTLDPTRGQRCAYPAISYVIDPNGRAVRSCGPMGTADTVEFISDAASLVGLPRKASCPQSVCLCLDRYAFLDEVPERGQRLNLLEEYVDACEEHQRAWRAARASGRGAS